MNSQICRICLMKGTNMLSFFGKINIFDTETSVNEIFSCILSYPKVVETPENTPQYVCEQCVLSMKQAYVFKLLCHLSQEYVDHYYKPSKTNKIQKSISNPKLVENASVKLKNGDNLNKIKSSKSNEHVCKECEEECVHKHTHSKQEIACNICGKSFRKQSTLVKHLDVHDKQRHKCDICSKSFAIQRHLDTHKKNHIEPKKYICSTCGEGFTTASLLNTHSRSHLDRGNFPCSICGKRYMRLMHLTFHMRSHFPNKPHVCTVCQQNFMQDNELNVHMRKHAEKDGNICLVCKRNFGSLGALKRHVRFHSAGVVDIFKCKTCGKGFSESGVLAKHNKIHMGKKPYSCPLCSSEFAQLVTMRRHLRGHSENLVCV